MPDRSGVVLDLALARPACHACWAPAIVERDGLGLVQVTWRHERGCRVPRSRRERPRLDANLAAALAGGRA